jgi:hypothetical protein
MPYLVNAPPAGLTTVEVPTAGVEDFTPFIEAAAWTRLGQIEAWLVANPNGAVLTAGETAYLARALCALTRLHLAQTAIQGQAT